MNSASVARDQGAKAGAALRGLGINVDFAPVADVPASTTSFMYRAGRTWSFNATRTAVLADAFASGLESKGVRATMKHFPGIGFATRNTDAYVVTIGATQAALAPGLLPYRTAIAHHIPLIMLSNATYSAYDTINAAGWSRAIQVNLLRQTLGFTGVTITDSLDGTAHARGLPTGLLAVRAARAGTDMILMTGSEASTRAVYATLLADAKSGYIQTDRLRASYTRILALKAGLGETVVGRPRGVVGRNPHWPTERVVGWRPKPSLAGRPPALARNRRLCAPWVFVTTRRRSGRPPERGDSWATRPRPVAHARGA